MLSGIQRSEQGVAGVIWLTSPYLLSTVTKSRWPPSRSEQEIKPDHSCWRLSAGQPGPHRARRQHRQHGEIDPHRGRATAPPESAIRCGNFRQAIPQRQVICVTLIRRPSTRAQGKSKNDRHHDHHRRWATAIARSDGCRLERSAPPSAAWDARQQSVMCSANAPQISQAADRSHILSDSRPVEYVTQCVNDSLTPPATAAGNARSADSCWQPDICNSRPSNSASSMASGKPTRRTPPCPA